MTTLDHHTDRIAAALAETRATVREENRAAWEVQTPALDHPVRVRIADDWLLFEASLDPNGRGATGAAIFLPEELIQWNATLPGGAKFGVDAQFNLTVRAEVPLLEDIDPGPRSLEALHGVLSGLWRFANPAPDQTTAPSRPAALDLRSLAGETGWAFTARDDGRITFALPWPAGTLTATLHARDDGGVRMWVPLAELTEITTPSRHALAVFLLRAGTVLRLARPVFATDGEQNQACLEVVFDSAPIAAELTQALESLAVGVALAAAEARLLCQEQTAREYLTVGTWTPREQGKTTNSERTR